MTYINKDSGLKKSARNDKNTPIFIIETESKNSLERTLSNMMTDRQGLDEATVAERQEFYGKNQVVHEKAPPALYQLLQAFNNPFIFILLVLAAISTYTDYWMPLKQGEETDLTGVIIIVVMVLLSAFLRFWQEFRTNKAYYKFR